MGEFQTDSRYDGTYVVKIHENEGDRFTMLNTQNGAKIHENH